MCSWDTTPENVDAFAVDLSELRDGAEVPDSAKLSSRAAAQAGRGPHTAPPYFATPSGKDFPWGPRLYLRPSRLGFVGGFL
jgi:hypothetical protein